MEKAKKKASLISKSLSLIAASVAMISNNQVQAKTLAETPIDAGNHNISAKRILKPNLVLKLNMRAPAESLMSMHTSHASHSSHASHASSSPGYTPSDIPATPVYTPATPVYTPPAPAPAPRPASTAGRSSAYTDNLTVPAQTVPRVLYKGLKGDDVKQMQLLLKARGYNTPVSGYFGEQTESAVKKFQKNTDLPIDGKVGSLTLSLMNN